MAEIGLAEAIEELRRELGRAQDAGAGQQLRFEVAEAELELLLELRREASPEARLSFGVVSAGVAGAVATARTHRLTLRLTVRDEATGGRNAHISQDRSTSWGD
ncbi:trypco2 family protein [Streptomyces sp. NPDC051183]|uniref:trypco2 family protein n=1 Tax=unclassified Streptomyces TaxID=2593676 RepID=UPI0034328561